MKPNTTRIGTGVLTRLLLIAFVLASTTVSVAMAQFNPAAGNVNTAVSFSSANSGSQGPYTLTKNGLSLSVTRPAPLPTFNFTCSPLLGATTQTVAWSFVTPHSLLIKCTSSTNIESKTSLHLQRLDQDVPLVTLYSRTDLITDQPNPQVWRNADGMVLFTPFS